MHKRSNAWLLEEVTLNHTASSVIIQCNQSSVKSFLKRNQLAGCTEWSWLEFICDVWMQTRFYKFFEWKQLTSRYTQSEAGCSSSVVVECNQSKRAQFISNVSTQPKFYGFFNAKLLASYAEWTQSLWLALSVMGSPSLGTMLLLLDLESRSSESLRPCPL